MYISANEYSCSFIVNNSVVKVCVSTCTSAQSSYARSTWTLRQFLSKVIIELISASEGRLSIGWDINSVFTTIHWISGKREDATKGLLSEPWHCSSPSSWISADIRIRQILDWCEQWPQTILHTHQPVFHSIISNKLNLTTSLGVQSSRSLVSCRISSTSTGLDGISTLIWRHSTVLSSEWGVLLLILK